jgi:hypothetical protein
MRLHGPARQRYPRNSVAAKGRPLREFLLYLSAFQREKVFCFALILPLKGKD